MRQIILAILLILFSCEKEGLINTVSFSGQVIVIDKITVGYEPDPIVIVPLQGVKIDLLVPVSAGVDSILKSTITNSKGKYLIQIEDLDDRFEFYKIDISDEYYKNCTFILGQTPSGHMAIQRTSENIWNLGACVTGKVKTTISKASALTKDTLNIVVSTRSPYDNYFIDSNPITVTTDTLWTKAYYYNDVGLIQYIIELKKENGDIIRWIEEKELQPKETIKFDIEF